MLLPSLAIVAASSAFHLRTQLHVWNAWCDELCKEIWRVLRERYLLQAGMVDEIMDLNIH